jgi:3-hydroxy-9,10-secoandrosta-1,3,5(10)-triene-9,17-dione monooxygenase reductase component
LTNVRDPDNSQKLRQALGQFATGVTIVTTSGFDSEPIGLTANSFSSVSLEPPLVLWSLADDALSREAFLAAEYFCVHILGAGQLDVSERFACRGEETFREVKWSCGIGSVPLLHDYVARFQCRTLSKNAVGDHIVFVGEVLDYDTSDERPLVFHGGQYALAERRMMERMAHRFDEDLPDCADKRTVRYPGSKS